MRSFLPNPTGSVGNPWSLAMSFSLSSLIILSAFLSISSFSSHRISLWGRLSTKTPITSISRPGNYRPARNGVCCSLRQELIKKAGGHQDLAQPGSAEKQGERLEDEWVRGFSVTL